MTNMNKLPNSTYGSVAFLIALALVSTAIFGTLNHYTNKAQAQVIISPLATSKPKPTATPIASNPITDYVKEVFGKYAPQAFLLLSCENKTLNPNATHLNNNGSTDFGLFQLNDTFWGFNKTVNNKAMLLDSRVNTLLAYKIFEHDGYSFEAWSCYKLVF